MWTPEYLSASRHGWPRGAKGARIGPVGHWNTSTFVTALRHDQIEAPWVLDGPINGDAFRIYVETQLVPTPGRGDIAVMCNLGSHKTEAARAAIQDAGPHPLLLPPSSAGSIKQVFAKLKHFLRKERPRTRDDLWKTVGAILKKLRPKECANCLVNSGYAAVQPG